MSEENNLPIQQKSRFKNKPFIIWICFQIAVIISIIAMICVRASTAKTIEVPMNQMKSNYLKLTDGSWYIDEELVPTDETINMMAGPFIELKKGSYTVTVDYDCTSWQVVNVGCNGDMGPFIKSGSARLYEHLHQTSFRVLLKENIDTFKLIFRYDGYGSLRVKGISIKEDCSELLKNLVCVLTVFLLIDFLYIFWEKVKSNKENIFVVICIAFLVSIPLFNTGINSGHDIEVHLMRIEAIAGELQRGVFPVRMSSEWIEGYGYAASIYYGDFLLYVPAVLRICGFDVTLAYKIYVFLINLGTSAIGYYSFKGIFKNEKYGLVASLVYSTASYRLTNIYVRAAAGEYSAMMFVPLVALAMYKIYTDDITDKPNYRKNSTLLAIGMAGIICTHILSAEMTVVMLAILCLVLSAYTFRLETLKTLALAVVKTLMLGAFFIVPFIDYYFSVDVRINDKISDMSETMIQKKGICLAEYFGFFRDIFSGNLSHHKNHRMLLTPGFVLVAVLIIALYFIVKQCVKKEKGAFYIYTAFSLVPLYMATSYFPWDAISLQPGLGNMLAQIQFPWRYVGVSIIFLTLLYGSVLKSIDKNKTAQYIKITFLICAITTMTFASNYLDDSDFVTYYNGADLETCSVGQGEYMRSNAHYGDIDGFLYCENLAKAEIIDRNGCNMKIQCQGTDAEGYLTLPVFNYKGYCAVGNGEKFEISDGINDQIKLKIPAYFNGIITLSYKPPILWHIAEIISVVSVVLLLFCRFFEKKRRKKL